MDSETTLARLAESTSGGALDDLRAQLDLTRVIAQTHQVEDAEPQIVAALRRSLAGAGTPAETLQQLRSRWTAT